jgi:hypothetical protein
MLATAGVNVHARAGWAANAGNIPLVPLFKGSLLRYSLVTAVRPVPVLTGFPERT